MSIAREISSTQPLPILDLAYRARQLAFRRTQISQWLQNERDMLRNEVEFRKTQGQGTDEDFFASRVANIEREAVRQEKDALAVYGMLEGSDERIAPMRRALAVWGLTADDIGVLSIHGTSTGANVSLAIWFSYVFIDGFHAGEKRDRHLEQHLHIAISHIWQRRPYHGPEELVRSLEGWFRCLAVGGSLAKCFLGYRARKPQR